MRNFIFLVSLLVSFQVSALDFDGQWQGSGEAEIKVSDGHFRSACGQVQVKIVLSFGPEYSFLQFAEEKFSCVGFNISTSSKAFVLLEDGSLMDASYQLVVGKIQGDQINIDYTDRYGTRWFYDVKQSGQSLDYKFEWVQANGELLKTSAQLKR